MVKLSDATFFLGTCLVIVALVIAYAALTRDSLPIHRAGVDRVRPRRPPRRPRSAVARAKAASRTR